MTSRRYVDLLWCQAARVDSRIEPIACGEKQWQEDDSSIILEMARREGERIAVEEDRHCRVEDSPSPESRRGAGGEGGSSCLCPRHLPHPDPLPAGADQIHAIS